MPMRSLLLLVLFVFAAAHFAAADELPICSNRVIVEVTKRVGCTIGDANCWFSKGGFCTDYITKMARRGQTGQEPRLTPIRTEDVKKGDAALFSSRPHYAYVEKVIRDKSGKPVAVNVSEYNYGACWVDEQALVTEKYKVVNRRNNIPIGKVDGGFFRPR